MTDSQKIGSISIFFPAFNDEATIAGLVVDAFATLDRLTDDYEVIVVNDGSRDSTGRVLEQLGVRFPALRVITHQHNQGYGGALRSGLGHARKDLVFYTDGDGQYDVRELPRLLGLMSDGVEIVNGYKLSRSDNRRRRIAGALYNRMVRVFFPIPIRDVDCDFRLMRRGAVGRIDLTMSSGAICAELVSKLRLAGCRFAETPVNHYPRLHGRSQFFTPIRVARTLRDLWVLWWRLVVPSRFAATPQPVPTVEH